MDKSLHFVPFTGRARLMIQKFPHNPRTVKGFITLTRPLTNLIQKKKRKLNCQVKPKESDLLETKAEEDIR